jgi:CheY-like chemotaxis protein
VRIINRKILRQVAKQNGVSVAEVRKGIEEAIDKAYEKPNPQALAVECKGEKPTPEELIAHIAKNVENAQKVNTD